MTEKERRLPFGRKVRCGNFTVLKYTRTLSRSEMKDAMLAEKGGGDD